MEEKEKSFSRKGSFPLQRLSAGGEAARRESRFAERQKGRWLFVPFFQRLCHGMWLFHLRSMMKIRPFSAMVPLAGPMAGIVLVIPLEFQEVLSRHMVALFL